VLGVAYFGVLYHTVRLLVRSSTPRLLLTVSFVVRLLVVLGAFYALVGWGAPAMLAGLAGFMIARFCWLRPRCVRGGKPAGKKTREPDAEETDIKR